MRIGQYFDRGDPSVACNEPHDRCCLTGYVNDRAYGAFDGCSAHFAFRQRVAAGQFGD